MVGIFFNFDVSFTQLISPHQFGRELHRTGQEQLYRTKLGNARHSTAQHITNLRLENWSISRIHVCHVCRRKGNPWGRMCSLDQVFPSIRQGANSDIASGATAKQPGSEIDHSVHQTMDSTLGKRPKFVEHLVVATVADFIEGEIIEDLIRDLNDAMSVAGVLATHIGRCEAFLGEHSFMIHTRAVDTASSDAAHRAMSEVYGKHLTPNNKKGAEGFGDVVVVDFNSSVVGAWDDHWPAIRIAIFQYKKDTSEEIKKSLIQHLDLLPTLFPSVKQVSWGRNIAKERTYRKYYGYADVDHELGVILGFSCSQDMYALGANPKYWELLNYHGISLLEKYQVLTYCET